MDVSVYDAQADTINVDDISTNSNNRIVLRRLQRNNANDYNGSLYIENRHEEDGEDCTEYVPEGSDDMGWLGYFVGRNEYLERLYIESFTPTSEASVLDVLEPFLRGVSRNKSIRDIGFAEVDLLGG